MNNLPSETTHYIHPVFRTDIIKGLLYASLPTVEAKKMLFTLQDGFMDGSVILNRCIGIVTEIYPEEWKVIVNQVQFPGSKKNRHDST